MEELPKLQKVLLSKHRERITEVKVNVEVKVSTQKVSTEVKTNTEVKANMEVKADTDIKAMFTELLKSRE